MKNTTVLIVDDEREIRELIGLYLKNEGYQIFGVSNGKEALQVIRKECIDLVILDWMMPVMDGMQTCIEIRKTHFMPILMLTAKGSDLDLMQGITIGADDYMKKPFNPLEVVLRVKSLLRRYKEYGAISKTDSSTLKYGELTLDTNSFVCQKADQLIRLTPKEFGILTFFLLHPNQVLSLAQIYENVWREQAYETDNIVMVHINKLREKIEDDPRNPQYIKTVWGKGYRL